MTRRLTLGETQPPMCKSFRYMSPKSGTLTFLSSMIQMRWDNVGDPVQGPADELGPEIRSDMVATSGYDDLTVYVNYAYGDETLEQIYGKEKLPKLAQLKAQYDPNNAFGFYHALPTSYP